MVGVGRLELPASWSRTKRATKLRYTPKMKISSQRWIFSLLWLPEKDSNPYKQSQSLSCYPYTIGQDKTKSLFALVENVYYYTLSFQNVNCFFKKIFKNFSPYLTLPLQTMYHNNFFSLLTVFLSWFWIKICLTYI